MGDSDANQTGWRQCQGDPGGVEGSPEEAAKTRTVERGEATRPPLPFHEASGSGTAMGLNSGSSSAVSKQKPGRLFAPSTAG